MLQTMKSAFFLHFVIGCFIYSNGKLLNSGKGVEGFELAEESKFQESFKANWYGLLHLQVFIGGNLIFFVICVFASFSINYCTRDKLDEQDASDDYYKECSVDFLIAEYTRA